MGYNARNDEIRDNVTRMRREWEAQRNALATVRRFNATLSAKAMFGSGPRLPPPARQNITGSLLKLRQLRHCGGPRLAR
jgi:hypothetical protein